MTRAKPCVACQCQQCGREFSVKPYRANDPTRGKFCSQACYWASKHRPQRPIEERFWSKVKKGDGCWLWQGATNHKGYGRFRFGGRNGTEMNAHRAAWLLTNGPIPDGMHACHHCDNPPCVRPDHLFLGSGAENMQDKVAKARQQRGARVPGAKLSEAVVYTIRERFAAGGVTQEQLGQEFGIAATTVNNLIHRKTWKHVN